MNFFPSPESGAAEWDAYTPPGERRHNFDYWYSYGAMNRHMHPHYWHDSSRMININRWSAEHDTDVFIKYLESVKGEDRPVLAFLSWNPPHPPYTDIDDRRKALYTEDYAFRPNVPEEWRCDRDYLEKRHDYFAAVAGLDEQFARLVTYLKDSGMYDNSIIVLSGDHGDMMGSQGLYGKNVWYEESIGVLFLIRYVDRFVKGRTDTVLNGVDIMPTILSLMDISISEYVEGISLKDSILNNSENDNYAIICGYPGQIKAIKELEEAGKSNLSYGWRAVRTKQYTYVINMGYNKKYGIERLLYDNINDVYQLNPKKIDNISYDKIAQMLEYKIRQWAEV